MNEIESEKVPFGKCPEHGVITHDAVLWNFPAPPECVYCGNELEVAGMAEESEVEEYK